MIAVRTDLADDVETILSELASGPSALVRVDRLQSRLKWEPERLQDVLATAESDQLAQTWEDDAGVLHAVLTPYGADLRGLRLTQSNRWVSRGSKPDRNNKRCRSGRTLTETDLDLERDGLFDLNARQAPDQTPLEILAQAEEQELAERAERKKSKKLQAALPATARPVGGALLMGSGPWPPRGTILQNWKITGDELAKERVMTIRVMVPSSKACPVCGKQAPGKRVPINERPHTRCLVCECWETDRPTLPKRLETPAPKFIPRGMARAR